MSTITQHHNEWFSLIEISGPFLRLTVLMLVFAQILNTNRGLAAIPGEIEQEKTGILKRFSDPQTRMFPVAVMFLIPKNKDR
jgi:hypothetical protein